MIVFFALLLLLQWTWCCCCCCGCIACQVQHDMQRALVALTGHISFLSFFPFLPLSIFSCFGGCTQHSTSSFRCSQCWSVTDPDPPRISPQCHVSVRHILVITHSVMFVSSMLLNTFIVHTSYHFSLFSESLFLALLGRSSNSFSRSLTSSSSFHLLLTTCSSLPFHSPFSVFPCALLCSRASCTLISSSASCALFSSRAFCALSTSSKPGGSSSSSLSLY